MSWPSGAFGCRGSCPDALTTDLDSSSVTVQGQGVATPCSSTPGRSIPLWGHPWWSPSGSSGTLTSLWQPLLMQTAWCCAELALPSKPLPPCQSRYVSTLTNHEHTAANVKQAPCHSDQPKCPWPSADLVLPCLMHASIRQSLLACLMPEAAASKMPVAHDTCISRNTAEGWAGISRFWCTVDQCTVLFMELS